jgi:cyclin D1/2/4, plant
MSPSLDYVASILLCSEDSAAVLDLEEEESDEISGVLGPSSLHVDDSPWALWVELPLQSDHCIELLLKREEEHLPMEGYAERLMQQPGGSDLVAVRKHAIEWIWKVSIGALLLSSFCVIHA